MNKSLLYRDVILLSATLVLLDCKKTEIRPVNHSEPASDVQTYTLSLIAGKGRR